MIMGGGRGQPLWCLLSQILDDPTPTDLLKLVIYNSKNILFDFYLYEYIFKHVIFSSYRSAVGAQVMVQQHDAHVKKLAYGVLSFHDTYITVTISQCKLSLNKIWNTM